MKQYFISDEEIFEVRKDNLEVIDILLKKFSNILEEVYKKINFLGKEFFLQIERKIIKNICLTHQGYNKDSNSVIKDFVKHTNNFLLVHLADNNYKILNDYLQFCGKDKLIETTKFLRKIGYEEDIDTTLAIFDNCPAIVVELDELFRGVESYSNRWINSFSYNNLMKHFIRMYMLKNDIVDESLNMPEEEQWKVKMIVEKFPESDQEMFYKKCGDDLLGTGVGKLAKEERGRFYGNLLPRIGRYYDNLRRYDDTNEFAQQLERIFDKTVKNNASFSNLILYFKSSFTFEEITQAMADLTDEEKQLVYKRFGANLTGESGIKLEKEENIVYNTKILPKIKVRLRNMYPDRSSYENNLLRNTVVSSKESSKEVKVEGKSTTFDDTLRADEAAKDEPLKKEAQIKEATFVELSTPQLSEEVKPEVNLSNVEQVLPNISQENEQSNVESTLQSNKLTADDFRSLKEILKLDAFKELTKVGFPLEQVVVVSMYHGYLNRSFTIDEISSILGIEKEVVKEMIIDSLKVYRSLTDQMFDNSILALKKL